RGSDGFVVQADVSRPDQIKQMFGKVQTQFKKLDIFVSNARPEVPTFFQAPMDITLEQWDTAFDSQAKAFLVVVREAVPLMVRGGTPRGRLGTPEDVGKVVTLFCSEQASWITGQVIYADGGASLMNPEVPPEIQLA